MKAKQKKNKKLGGGHEATYKWRSLGSCAREPGRIPSRELLFKYLSKLQHGKYLRDCFKKWGAFAIDYGFDHDFPTGMDRFSFRYLGFCLHGLVSSWLLSFQYQPRLNTDDQVKLPKSRNLTLKIPGESSQIIDLKGLDVLE